MTVAAPVEPPPSLPQREHPVLNRLIKVGGVVFSLTLAVLTGAFEIILSPLRVGGFPLCVSILLAVAANYAIAWFAYTTVGRRRAVAVPWAAWTLFMLLAAGTRTTEGDYLIYGENWVALAMILFGSLAFAIYAYRMILKPVQNSQLPHSTGDTGS